MESLAERLKIRIMGASEELLEELLASATAIYIKLKWPYGGYPEPEDLDFIANDWIIRCAVELYNKIGGEGQTIHNENAISRQWDSGTVSANLIREVMPVCNFS